MKSLRPTTVQVYMPLAPGNILKMSKYTCWSGKIQCKPKDVESTMPNCDAQFLACFKNYAHNNEQTIVYGSCTNFTTSNLFFDFCK